jgi:DNA invertase Pin-like site-specific DNA recombinase
MIAHGYIRVSTGEQADSGLGLEAQTHAIVDEIARRGWEPGEVFEDAGYSARSLNRPALQQVLERLDSSESPTTLVVARLDRLSRSLMDFCELMQRAKAKGWLIVTLDANVDMSTPSGELMANVMASFAQFERQLIGQRTSEALQEKKRQGVKLGRPITVDAEAVRTIQELRADGLSYGAIAEWMNHTGIETTSGGKRWWPETVRQIDQREAA